jgi:acetyltransferase-like isoleucine patch superfamily enzyme
VLIEKPRIPLPQILLYGWWPGFLKLLFYRLCGYKIGRHVSIGFGSVICADDVTIGDHTSIGFLTIIRAKTVRLGSYVQIRSLTFLDTPHVEIGDGTRINEQVFVGGLQGPDSRLVLGRNCQVMQMSFLNPARSIVVGDDTGIGGHCLIFGHTSWLSQFEGYPVEFAPIEIGNSVSIAWGVFVLPNSVIGDGSVIGARSVVHGAIPPKSLAVGFPARVVNRPPEFPRAVSDEERIGMFRDIVSELVGYFTAAGFSSRQDGELYEFWRASGKWRLWDTRRWRLLVVERGVREVVPGSLADLPHVVLSLDSIAPQARRSLTAAKVAWVDIARKEQSRYSNDLGDEVALFLRRYGVRTTRC